MLDNLNYNNLENLPDLTAMTNLVQLYVYNNKFEFDDLQATRTGIPNLYFNYNPQYKFGNIETFNKHADQSLTLTAEVGGIGNVYQWYKDENPLDGKTENILVFDKLLETDLGSYTCQVPNPDVPNLTLESEAMQINVAPNIFPVANAGIDISVDEGTLARLDGSLSLDENGDDLTYLWTAPDGITLSSTTDAKPTFTAPEVSENTEYTFSLVVKDGSLSSVADKVTVMVNQVNKAPIANAGDDQSVNETVCSPSTDQLLLTLTMMH